MSAEAGEGAARGVFKNTVVLAIARIVERGTTLVLSLVLASKLGASGLGTYATALAIYGVIAIAGEAGATLFLIRELAKDKSRTASYVVHLSVMAAFISLGLMVIAEVLFRHVGYSPEVRDSVALVCLAILPKTLNSIQEAAFIVHERTEFETITRILASGTYLVTSWLLLSKGHGVTSVVGAYVAIEYVVTGAYYVMISRSIARLRWGFDRGLARRLVGEIKSFTASSALGALFARPEIIILSLLSTSREVGLYSAAVRIAELWLFVPQVFMNNVYPVLTRAHQAGDERFQVVQSKAIVYALAYALPLTAGMLAGAEPIIDTLFGSAFGPSVDELRLLALNVTLFTLMSVFWRSVSARGHQDAVLRIQSMVIVTRLSIGTALILPFASLGAALATAINTGLHLGLLARAVRRYGAPAGIVRTAWRFGLAAAVSGGAIWLLSDTLSLWLLTALGASLYVGAIVVFRAFAPEDVRALRALLPARSAASRAS
jgi:O-antigen/teichoic acid export membrane protein